jgi:hypothetical protein
MVLHCESASVENNGVCKVLIDPAVCVATEVYLIHVGRAIPGNDFVPSICGCSEQRLFIIRSR